ncbi:OLC1v1026231C1 [Oldenlandia corymbosa var. corymbosa]|uniref:OLC1v1026231C1 n=1 Tax=Oldenlandia corymbosa var. corymbosa TaxID=529605 RepID=A0AAV1C9K7_OLDCO|nr:OLC1v1026231C1 [Oldenlandia corymbosa var. corymbosa]
MSFRKGFLMPQDSGGFQPGSSWSPVTPEKPVTRNNGVIQHGSHWIPATPEAAVRNDRALHGGESWIPLTPGNAGMQASHPVANQMQRSLLNGMNPHELLGSQHRISVQQPVMQTAYPTLDQVQGHQTGSESWKDIVGFCQGVLQETSASGASHDFSPTVSSVHGEHNKKEAPVRTNGLYNQSSNSYMQNWIKDVNREERRVIQATNKLPLVNPYRATGNERAKFEYDNSMLPPQKQAFTSNQGIITSGLQSMQSDEIPIRYSHVCNLNSPPREESSAVSCAAYHFQSAPETPDQGKQLQSHHLSDAQNFPSNGSMRQQKDNQELASKSNYGDNLLDELLDNDVVTLPVSNTTSLKENDISGDGGHMGIDLNKTPQQRTPRRKKHRPKVVVEGKPKKNPKPTAVETKVSGENPSGKRKYVRSKANGTSNSTPGNENLGTDTPAPSSAAKSCRRVLNFDLEGKINDNANKMVSDMQQTSLKSRPFDLNLKSQDTVWSKEFDRIPDISAPMVGQQIGRNSDIQQDISSHHPIGDNYTNIAAKGPPPVHPVPTTTLRGHTLDSIARSLNLQTTVSCQNNDQFGFIQGHQPLKREGTGKMLLQANSSLSNFYGSQPLYLRSSTACMKEIAEDKVERGSKRDYCHTSQIMNPQPAGLIPFKVLHHETWRTEQTNEIGKTGVVAAETNKRRKFEDARAGVLSSLPSCFASVQGSSRIVELKGCTSSQKSSFSSYPCGPLPNVNLGKWSNIRKHNTGGSEILSNEGIDIATAGNGFKDQMASRALQNLSFLMAGKMLHPSAEADNLYVTTGITDRVVHPGQRVPATTQGNGTRTSPIDLSLMHSIKPAASVQASQEKLHLNVNKKPLLSQKSPKKIKERKERENHAVTINEIIDRLEGLEISKRGKNLAAKEQNAIVPYKGDDRVVPYEVFDPIKRHRPRPKVDLDPETNRIWNILMGKAGSDHTETAGNEKEKEKWWEEERKVVRGRIDSFIARMHLVQGDRRFSVWKGSVVDSVIGVFLTQNVSDHLSSSAFISLASKFSVQLTNSKSTPRKYESISWIEHDVQTVNPDGIIAYHGSKMRYPFYQQNSMILSASPEKIPEHLISGTVNYLNENNSGTEEEVVSSQNSSDSFPQSTKYMRSSSDSEVEDQMVTYNSKKCCISESTPKIETFARYQQHQCQQHVGNLLRKNPMSRTQQHANPACNCSNPSINCGSNEYSYPVNSDSLVLQGSLPPSSVSWLNKATYTGVNESYYSGFSENKTTSSFCSNSSEITNIGNAAHAGKNIGVIAGSANCSTTQETRTPINHEIRMGQTQCSNQHHEEKLQPGFHFGSSQESVNSHQTQPSKSVQQERKPLLEPKRLDAADVKGKTGETYFSGEQFGNTDANIPNAKKRKQNVDKKQEFDWDSLRRKVLAKIGKIERTQENMDSLDYEALRHADVKTISDTILERGMNNMLAERIKDFLNRLIRDHGSIDLEWLREVEGDEAKDYLLSIRGLGLKSVECVRLLTLHQVAFPVDTNVGRIAVRLGWVPLQPLPESLQLHLLELYPILESVQKYLWPRLCKLDQRTLYELHYQLITFGKVFCTKRKPNCNACPMRAECRHFASAFASARLALPGPEERSLVNITTPAAVNEIPPIRVESIPLLPAETSFGRELHYSGSKYEPIVEEPASPEPSPEAPESDIEDLFYEDPDEIPTIKLSLEDLKVNLESVIRDQNMELQPGDLSMALVALDASTASIPVPKLKNASRLRTEHQVYELPDSHPLLKEMERREPDDPSPYLLAIWGPGETADSSQPPEGCSSSYVNENNSQTVRGTLLIPCRTAMRGSFPLNGTYFQVNEMFADHESSRNPINVPRDWIWQLPRRTVYFGTSVTSIFRGLTTEGIQYCFWRGFVCVRGFDRQMRAPRPLNRRLHEAASRTDKNKNSSNGNQKKTNAEETAKKKAN